ncbi:MAG: SemiSWEET family sugar transporter [Lacibacter sp.]|jgi:MtN3 and saliva related transmembrane protein
MTIIDIMGHLGSFLSSITFMPQVYKAWKSKRIGDLSIYTILIVLCSTVIWLVYGLGYMLWPVIICNAIICMLSFLLLYFKLTYKN